jgi:predicted Zn-dependent protease
MRDFMAGTLNGLLLAMRSFSRLTQRDKHHAKQRHSDARQHSTAHCQDTQGSQENVNYARDDWSNNTDLNIAVGSSSSFNIAAYANPYGYPWEGNAVMYKYEYGQYKACSDYISTTYYGDCNGPVAVFAYVYLNTNYNTAASDNTKRGMIARHEMGHVWGLDHTSCVVTSLMRGYSCAWLAPPTKSDERVWVDANYP